jgi:Fe-S cluster biogenesis protein NfuA
MFIQTEATPNPATLKFLPGRDVIPGGTAEFRSPDETESSPLAQQLFSIEGVTGVFFGSDFITITKGEADWQHLRPAILGTIMQHFMSGAPVMTSDAPQDDGEEEFFDETDGETVMTIKELLDTRVRPAVAHDGGDIVFRGFQDGVVYLKMRGACAGCPSSTATLRHGIQNLLRHFVPEVEEVRPV